MQHGIFCFAKAQRAGEPYNTHGSPVDVQGISSPHGPILKTPGSRRSTTTTHDEDRFLRRHWALLTSRTAPFFTAVLFTNKSKERVQSLGYDIM